MTKVIFLFGIALNLLYAITTSILLGYGILIQNQNLYFSCILSALINALWFLVVYHEFVPGDYFLCLTFGILVSIIVQSISINIQNEDILLLLFALISYALVIGNGLFLVFLFRLNCNQNREIIL